MYGDIQLFSAHRVNPIAEVSLAVNEAKVVSFSVPGFKRDTDVPISCSASFGTAVIGQPFKDDSADGIIKAVVLNSDPFQDPLVILVTDSFDIVISRTRSVNSGVLL